MDEQNLIQEDKIQEDEVDDLGYEDEEKEDRLYPIDRDKVQVVVNNRTIFNIVEYIKRGKIDLQPIFQRSYVRNDEKAEKLIDSIRNGLPIPQLFLLSKEDGKSLVIDGQQRLTSLIRFILNEEELKKDLPDTNFAEFKEISELKLKVRKKIFSGKEEDKDIKISFDELDNETKDKFEGESLIVAQIRPTYTLFEGKKDDLNKLSKEIFYRLNTGGVKLTDQEIRQSLYHGKFMREIRKISFSTEWRRLLPTGIQKISNDPASLTEMILRAFSFLDCYGNKEDFDSIGLSDNFSYIKPLSEFLDKYAKLTDGFSEKLIDDRISLLTRLLNKLNSFTDESIFKHNKLIDTETGKQKLSNSFNVKYIDTLFVGLLNLFRYKSDIETDLLKNKIQEFKNNYAFIKDHISKPGSSDPKYVKERVSLSIDFFKGLKNQ